MPGAGDITAGKYQIIRKIGSGGMSEVYLVKDLTLQRTWAMKVAAHGVTPQEKRKEQQILSEAMLMKRLDHPGFPRIVDLFREKDMLCIVMDYAEGGTLEQLIRNSGPRDEDVVVTWARQLCDMLSCLHGMDPPVIYRDLKPANIILRSSGRLCLTDFGIATAGAVREKVRAGTPGYAAPEQMLDGSCDERTDIYALGMTLYFLLTGLDPRDEAFREMNTDRLHFSAVGVSVSVGLQEIIRKCTAQVPAQRYRDCSELMRDLLQPVRPAVLMHHRKMRQRMLAVTVIAAVLLIAAGMIFQRGVREFTEDEIYAARLDPETSFTAEEKEQSYLNAIAMRPERSEGFVRLLELYEAEMDFGMRESRQLLRLFRENRQTLLADRAKAADLLRRIGKLYFFRFQGGDGSVRERILRAEPFFSEWKRDFGDFENTDAECLWEICCFYKTYALSAAGLQEPGNAELARMLSAVERLLTLLEQYSGSDRAAVSLTTLREMAGFLNAWRFAFFAAGMEETTIQTCISKIAEMTGSVETLRADHLQEKEQLKEDCAVFAENIRTAWLVHGNSG